MKKNIYIFVLFVFIFSCTEKEIIEDNTKFEFISPDHLITWTTGQYVEIKWKPKTDNGNTTPDNVSIHLFGNVLYGFDTIEKNAPNTGIYRWYIDPAIPYFGEYFIRLNYEDSEVFRIEPGIQSYTFLFPQQIDELQVDNIYTLRWNNDNELNNKNIRIELYKIDGETYEYYYLISSQTVNEGIYNWQVPTSIETGNYQIKIKAIDSDNFGISPKFDIIPIPPEPDFIQPNSNTVWQINTINNIEWNSKNWGEVDILLIPAGESHTGIQIADETSDDSIFEWNIENSISTGVYHIKIYDYYTILNGYVSYGSYIESENFQIE